MICLLILRPAGRPIAGAVRRKIFLLEGMPVAEDNNARYAIRNFNAEWFSIKRFKEWQETLGVDKMKTAPTR